MSGAQARRLCPQAVVVEPRMSAYSEASRPCTASSTTRRRWSRASRSTRPSSTCAGCERISGTPAEIAVRLRRAVLRAGRACRSRSASRARSSSPRSRAASPSPTACSSSRPRASSTFLHPLPVERLWGVGPRHRAEAARPGRRTVGEVAQMGEATLVLLLGAGVGAPPARARAQPRPAAASQAGRRRRSIGAQRALGRSPRSPEEVDAVARRARRSRHAADARRPARRPHGRAQAALRRLLARDPVAHAGACDCEHAADPRDRARAAPERCTR